MSVDTKPLEDVQTALAGDLPACTNVVPPSGVSDPSPGTFTSQDPFAPSRPQDLRSSPKESYSREEGEGASHTTRLYLFQAPEPPGETPVGRGDQRPQPEDASVSALSSGFGRSKSVMVRLMRRLAAIEGRQRAEANTWNRLAQNQRNLERRVNQVNDIYDYLAVECAKKPNIGECSKECAADLRRLTRTVTNLQAKEESLNKELEKNITSPSSGAGPFCEDGALHAHPQPSSRPMASGPPPPQPASQHQSSYPTRAGVGHGSIFAATSAVKGIHQATAVRIPESGRPGSSRQRPFSNHIFPPTPLGDESSQGSQ